VATGETAVAVRPHPVISGGEEKRRRYQGNSYNELLWVDSDTPDGGVVGIGWDGPRENWLRGVPNLGGGNRDI